MQTLDFPTLADDVRSLPPAGAARDRRLQHVINVHAAAQAAAALSTAASHTRSGALGRVLTSADAVLLSAADSAARDRLRDAVASPEFLSLIPGMIRELRESASSRPDAGACTVASALELWSWTANHFLTGEAARTTSASHAIDELAEALCPLLAARSLALEVTARKSSGTPAEIELRRDLCHVNAAHASAAAGTACAEIVFGYRRHLVWDAEGCASCYAGDAIDEMEGVMPGFASGARMNGDVVESDGSHPAKEGPCVRFDGVETFIKLRNRLDGCLTGARIASDRVAAAITKSSGVTTPSKSKGRA